MTKKWAFRFCGIIILAGLAWTSATLRAQQNEAPVDWDKARVLLQKQRSGQALTDDERDYLARARALRGGQGGNRAQGGGINRTETLLLKKLSGQTLTSAEQKELQQARENYAQSSRADADFSQLKPLTQMSGDEKYKGESGGLYGNGRNAPPPAQQAAAQAAIARIQPLDGAGHPAPEGRIVLLSVGMSNTTQEFSFFKRLADQSPLKSPRVVVVDGAQGGRDASDWADQTPAFGRRPPVWEVVAQRLRAANVTPQQVQAIWLKQALKQPAAIGAHPLATRQLQNELEKIVQTAQQKFPNLRVIYLSSRTFGGFASGDLNPEPYAYESAFAVRGLIEKQMSGDPALNSDSAKGAVRAPVLLWGPYLWGRPADTDAAASGTAASSDLTWTRADFQSDGTHPTPFGRAKVSARLLDFFTTSPLARSWFVAK